MSQRRVTLSNGAVARVLPNGQWRFVSGASPEYLDRIRPTGVRGPNTRPSGRAPSDAFLMRKLKADKRAAGVKDVARAVRADFARKSTKVLNRNNPKHARIIRTEGSLNRYDVRGFDDGHHLAGKGQSRGSKPGERRIRMSSRPSPVRLYPKRQATPAQLAALRKARAAKRTQTGGFWW